MVRATGNFSTMSNLNSQEVSGTKYLKARSPLPKSIGLSLLAGEVADRALPSQSFDTITLFHVLEHVPDPGKLVALCHDLLGAQGILVIAVPNDVVAWTSKIKKLGKRLGLSAFQKFSPKLGISRAGASREIHLSHFTPTVLRGLIERSGMHVTEESLDPYYASSGVRLFLDSAYYTVHCALHASLKINRYDTIWMVAQKP